MARVVWTGPALRDLHDIAAFIALDNEEAGKHLVKTVVARLERLERFPHSGKVLPELPGAPFREVVVPPCRVVYQVESGKAFVLCVLRAEQLLRPSWLERE